MRFIIDIPEKDVQSCRSCPFNYDFIKCKAPNGPNSADFYDFCGSNITTRPGGCPLVPVVPDQEEMNRNWPETLATENAKLRKLARDMNKWLWNGADCTECPFTAKCDLNAAFESDIHANICVGWSEIHDRMRELGVETDTYSRYHHAPTVEDVLCELLNEYRDGECTLFEDRLADYAKRLRLAEREEAWASQTN